MSVTVSNLEIGSFQNFTYLSSNVLSPPPAVSGSTDMLISVSFPTASATVSNTGGLATVDASGSTTTVQLNFANLSIANSFLSNITFHTKAGVQSNFGVAFVITSLSPSFSSIIGTRQFHYQDTSPTIQGHNAADAYTPRETTPLTAITVTDADNLGNVTVRLTLSDVLAGTIGPTTLFGSAQPTFSVGVWQVIGSITDVNLALQALTFTPSYNYDSVFTIATRVISNIVTVNGSKTMTATYSLCFAQGTQIRLQDGTTLGVEHLRPGMQLADGVRPSSLSREVASVAKYMCSESYIIPGGLLHNNQSRLELSPGHLLFDGNVGLWHNIEDVEGVIHRKYAYSRPFYHIYTTKWGSVLAEGVPCETAALTKRERYRRTRSKNTPELKSL